MSLHQCYRFMELYNWIIEPHQPIIGLLGTTIELQKSIIKPHKSCQIVGLHRSCTHHTFFIELHQFIVEIRKSIIKLHNSFRIIWSFINQLWKSIIGSWISIHQLQASKVYWRSPIDRFMKVHNSIRGDSWLQRQGANFTDSARMLFGEPCFSSST